MAKLKIFNVLSNLSDDAAFRRYCSAFINELYEQFNGRIQFKENIRASGIFTVEFTGSSDVQTVIHSLGIVPDGFLVISTNAAANIYAPTGSNYTWTEKRAYLQSSGAVTAKIYII